MPIREIARLIFEIDPAAVERTREALAAGVDPVQLLHDGVIGGLERVGEQFEAGEYFLPELIESGEIAQSCIEVINPHLPDRKGDRRGVVVIGAVQGDLHDIGYGLVALQLELAGFEVHSQGVDVAPLDFIEKAQQVDADIIGLSAFLVSTVPGCTEVLKYLSDMQLRDRFRVIIGGAQTSQEVSDAMGADGWAADAVAAVRLCRSLVQS